MSPKPKQYGLTDTTFSNRFDTCVVFSDIWHYFDTVIIDKKFVCGTLP